MSDTTLPYAAKKREAYTAHWWQVHAWGIGGITDYFMWEQFYLIMNIHTAVFKVSPLVVGAILSTPRLIDGILDPILGHWSDNLKSKWGRRRPFLLVAGLTGAVFAGTMFCMSPDWPQWLKGVMVAFFAIGLFVSVGTYDMAYTALGYELSEDYAERSRIPAIMNVYKGLGGIVGGFVVGLAASLPEVGDFLFGKAGHTWLPAWTHLRQVVTDPDGSGNKVIGFRVVSVVVACLMLVCLIFPLLWTRERYDAKINRQHVNIWKAFKATLRNRPFVILLLMQFASGAGSLSRNLFFFIGVYYVCDGNMALFSNVKGGGTAIVGLVLSWLLLPLVKPSTRIIGKRVAIIGGAALGLIQVCGYPIVATPGHIYWWFWYDNAFMIPSMILGAVAGGVMPDICDIDELEHGERREGMFTAVVSFMSKMQMSVIMLLTGGFLAWTGLQEGVTHQPAKVLHRLVLLGFTPLIVISAISFLVACFFPITAKMMERVRAELDVRHEAAGVLTAETTKGSGA